MSEIKAVVLAAGKGTRMQSESNHMPKVLREACGKPLLYHVLTQLDFIDQKNTVLVVGYLHELVEQSFPGYPTALQEPQMGTGHAVQCAKEHLKDFDGTVLVCYGDMPLVRKEVYESLLREHAASGAQCTLLSGTCEEYLPYGRVLMDADNNFIGVVEDRDCTEEQKKIRDLNVGIYAFDTRSRVEALDKLQNNNAQNEYYLTDAPALIQAAGGKVKVCKAVLNEQIIGVNTPEQLAQTEHFLRQQGRAQSKERGKQGMRAIKHCARGAVVLAMVLLFSGCSLYQRSQDGWEILAEKYIGGESGEQPEIPDTEALDTEAADFETPDETTAAGEPEESEADGIPGTYTVPDGWVKAEEHSTSEFIFYTREGETQDAQPDNISINVGGNLYSLEESGAFLDAIMRQLAMQAEAADANLTGSGSITEQGYTLLTFTIEGTDGTKAKQHYIVKDYGYCLIYATSFSGSEEVFDVAKSMVDSFVWDEDSAPAAE